MPDHKLSTQVDLPLNDGHKVPALAFGTVPPDDINQITDQVINAVRAGYRHIDTAWWYGSEPYIGKALKTLFAEGYKREDLFITTKVWHSFWHSPERSLDQSLESLGLDYVDLLLQHWPICTHGDENGLPPRPLDGNGNPFYDDDPVEGTKFIETYHKIEDVKLNTNKVRSVGVSNYSIPKLKKLLPQVKKFVPTVNQIEYHPHLPQKDLTDFCAEHKIVVECFSPVGGSGAPVVKDPVVVGLAKKYDVSANDVTNAYHILEGRVSIPRTFNKDRVENNIYLPPLTKDELQDLYNLGKDNPRRYTNDPWGYGLGFRWWDGDTLSKEFD